MTHEGHTLLGDHFTSRREKGTSGSPTLSVTLTNGLIAREDLGRKTDTNLSPEEHLLVKKGDIAYNMMRMWQGASGLAMQDGLVSPAYVVLSPKKTINSTFAAYLFKTPRMIHLFWAYSYGLTKDRLRLYYNDFKRIPIRIPSVQEQERIVEILSTWDKAIAIIENLLANNQKQKDFLMHQLLTGKKRFAGFDEEWRWASFDEILDIEIGGTPSRSNPDYWDEKKETENRWLSIRDIKGNVIFDSKEYITNLGVKNSNVTLIPAGSIVMSFKLTIGKAAILGNDFYTNEAICSLIPKDKESILPEFLIRALDKVDFDQEIDQAVKGKTLNKEKLMRLRIFLPSLKEQKKIASVLSAATKEVEAWQGQLAQLQLQKMALMQQLFTKNRLVKVE